MLKDQILRSSSKKLAKLLMLHLLCHHMKILPDSLAFALLSLQLSEKHRRHWNFTVDLCSVVLFVLRF
uniref:Uncharacterized protein n=1 Tax=Brassica oleracea TaxID=3712 RepID=A0A3P6BTW3_BRAOL|nr:unnamed protein product [Brassica oleracea]